MNERNQTSSDRQNSICISLGSNIDPHNNIRQALAELKKSVTVIGVSSIWKSPPYRADGANFLNAAVMIETDLDIATLKDTILTTIEEELCRVRTEDKNAPRTIDLDIITFGEEILDDNLWELSFIAVPVAEIDPELIHPETGETIVQIADRLSQNFEITRVDGFGI